MSSIQVAELFGRLGLRPDRKAWAEGTKLIDRMQAGLARMAKRAAIATAGIGVGALVLADNYTALENRIRQVASSNEHLNALMDRTRAIANATRSDWKATGEAYVRLTNATKALNLSEERRLKIIETLNMALQSSGASATEAAAGTLQLMQGLSSGALQGDEFRSIAEQLPDLLDLFAKEMGVSRGELKKLGAQGKITSKVVVASLENASESIRGKFAASAATAGQRWVQLKNSLMLASAEFMRATGFGEALARAVTRISDWIEGHRAEIAAFGAQVGRVFGVAYDAVAAVVGFLIDNSDATISVLSVLGAALSAWAVNAAAAWVMALGPIALIGAALSAIVFVVIKVVKHWDQLKAAVGRALSSITSKMRAAWNAVSAFGHGVADVFAEIGGGIKAAFQAVINWIGDKVRWVTSKVDWVVRQASKVQDFLGGDPEVAKKIRGAGAFPFIGASPAAAPRVPTTGPGPTSSLNVGEIKIDVHPSPGMDEQALAVNVGKQVRDEMRSVFLLVGAAKGAV